MPDWYYKKELKNTPSTMRRAPGRFLDQLEFVNKSAGRFIQFAQAALINMVGGSGYFHGSSIVMSRYNTPPVPYWEAPL